MKTVNKPYRPINCAFHDYLEHFATLRQPITIVYSDENTAEIITLTEAVIANLSGGREGEFSHITYPEGEIIIRNDYLVAVGNIKMSDFEDGNCGV